MKHVLMHENLPVAELEIDKQLAVILKINGILRPEHMPLGIVPGTDGNARTSFNEWWMGRSIPASRSGLRDALEIMRISSPALLLLKCYGLSLSDQYWMKPANKNLEWKDINFFENDFSADVGNALFGRNEDRGSPDLTSPDNTTDGRLQKKWINVNGKRVLLKGGSPPAYQEPFNEVIASRIMDRLRLPHAAYTLAWNTGKTKLPLSACEDFVTTDRDLVSAWRILLGGGKKDNNISYYDHTINCYEKAGIPGARDFLERMIVVDFILVNSDRHFNNFGALRNGETLEWLGPAPIFDCGTSLWHDQFTTRIAPGLPTKSKPFRNEHEKQIKLVKSFDRIDFSALQGIADEYRDLLVQSEYVDDERRDKLCFALQRRVEILQALAGRG